MSFAAGIEDQGMFSDGEYNTMLPPVTANNHFGANPYSTHRPQHMPFTPNVQRPPVTAGFSDNTARNVGMKDWDLLPSLIQETGGNTNLVTYENVNNLMHLTQ